VADGPVVMLNQAVAAAKVHGPAAGLALLDRAAEDPRLAGNHRVAAVRAHLLEEAGDPVAARSNYLEAARRTTSTPERRYLLARAERT
jgi:predicted RNA polymerase sigma factor